MDQKFPNEENPKQYVANTCSATCQKCHGQCALSSPHNSAHKCEAGHNW